MATYSVEEPALFRAAIGGYFGPSFSVEWEGDGLRYESSQSTVQTGWLKVRPTDARWRRFWEKCDDLNVWHWASHYEPDLVVTDGTAWEIDIECMRGKIHATGSNAYPPSGENEETKEFRAFCRAISSLVGGTPFQ